MRHPGLSEQAKRRGRAAPGGLCGGWAPAQALQRGGLCGRANLAPPALACSSVGRPQPEEIAVSESTQDRPDEADEKAPKPGEQDTETVAGQPKKAPESADGEQQSKQDE